MKLKYFVLIAVLCFCCLNCINALTCEYTDGKLTAVFKIDEKKNRIEDKATINGELKSTDETNIKNEEQIIVAVK